MRVQNGLETEVGQADTVVILPAMAGGALRLRAAAAKALSLRAHAHTAVTSLRDYTFQNAGRTGQRAA